MKFLYPDYFKLFFVLVALLPCWLYFIYTKRRSRRLLGVGRALTRMSRVTSLRRDVLRCLLLNLVMAAIIVALAHPQWMREQKIPQPGIMDLVFLLDTSPSMRAGDIQPSRLVQALDVMGSFVRTKLAQDRIGLISFAGNSTIVSYLTEDANNILYYIDYLKGDGTINHGTNIGRGLRNGLTVVNKEAEITPEAARHKKVFVLLSDGEDNGAELNAALAEVKQQGIKVHTLGVGSRDGAPIPIGYEGERPIYLEDDQGNRIISRFDEHTLQWIAENTGGKFYRSYSGMELEKTFAEIVLSEREIIGFRKNIEFQDFHHLALLAAAGIFLVALLL
ncbi:MAG: VWA domain-containing protein [Deltaproteobacteria bacterium]|nr:VWA domain-containing protein [Deltaproteobacteria bacterium]